MDFRGFRIHFRGCRIFPRVQNVFPRDQNISASSEQFRGFRIHFRGCRIFPRVQNAIPRVQNRFPRVQDPFPRVQNVSSSSGFISAGAKYFPRFGIRFRVFRISPRVQNAFPRVQNISSTSECISTRFEISAGPGYLHNVWIMCIWVICMPACYPSSPCSQSGANPLCVHTPGMTRARCRSMSQVSLDICFILIRQHELVINWLPTRWVQSNSWWYWAMGFESAFMQLHCPMLVSFHASRRPGPRGPFQYKNTVLHTHTIVGQMGHNSTFSARWN